MNTNGNGAQLVRPMAIIPNGAAVTPICAPNPLMDAAAWQHWCQAVSSFNVAAGARPGTPLLHPHHALRIGSPTPDVMNQHQSEAPSQSAANATVVQQRPTRPQAQVNTQKGRGSSSRSPSPAITSSNSQQSLPVANGSGVPLKASRHKYAEQRRRNRINERLDQLRTIVPHTEGTNIATFLDTVIEYVVKLQQTVRTSPVSQAHAVGYPTATIGNAQAIKGAAVDNPAGSTSMTTSFVDEEDHIPENSKATSKDSKDNVDRAEEALPQKKRAKVAKE
mmetsp:Transcript_4206/g.10820  ORF Transcript_4206/g.10820 Transcript_4206/m.10820 type:complete len:278 (-) Transcript_4206:1311-2144(-)